MTSPELAAKRAKAEEFLLAAELLVEFESYDAAVSLCVSAAINASDALIIEAGFPMPQGADHSQAIQALGQASDASTARQLRFVLGLKNRAQYSVQRCTSTDANAAITRATRLVNKAKGI